MTNDIRFKRYMLDRWAICRPSCLPLFTHHLKMQTLITCNEDANFDCKAFH